MPQCSCSIFAKKIRRKASRRRMKIKKMRRKEGKGR
jgi:hypothetical protein